MGLTLLIEGNEPTKKRQESKPLKTMRYHCKDKNSKSLSQHSSILEALRAREVWLHTRELIGITDNSGRLLSADELYQAKAAAFMKGLR